MPSSVRTFPESDLVHQELGPDLLASLSKQEYRPIIDRLLSLANQGNLAAATAAGYIFYFGGGGVRRDYFKAYHWLSRTHSFDSTPHSVFRLGTLLERGKGTNKDESRAHALFKTAAVRGHPTARLMVAAYYVSHKSGQKGASARILLQHALLDKKLGYLARTAGLFWLARLALTHR